MGGRLVCEGRSRETGVVRSGRARARATSRATSRANRGAREDAARARAWWTFVAASACAWALTRRARERDDARANDAPSDAFCARARDPMVCAHGGEVLEGEMANARTALERAARAGHACVEIDVQRTNDGALVALHARDVKRYTRGDIGAVGEVSRAELEMWNEGDAAALDFAAALEVARRAKFKQITVDFKENAPLGREGLARETVEVVRSMRCDECLMWGKDDETIREALRLGAPRVGYVVANFSLEMRAKGYDRLTRGRVRGAHAVAIQSEMVTRDLVRRARRAKLDVHVWTVNDDERMRRFLNYGVDGILTDRPTRLKETIADFRARCGREQL